MTTEIFCCKLKQMAKAMDHQPMPGSLGKKLQECVSEMAWQQWLTYQTSLINEHRLVVSEPEARQFLLAQLEKYFFSQQNIEDSCQHP